MKFYIYSKDSVSYKRFRFFRFKFLIPFVILQLIISVSLLFFISNFYNTPKERALKDDISYLLTEFDKINRRIIESEMVLEEIKQNDSIIYKSIFDVSDITKRDLEVYWDSDIENKYDSIAESTNQRISELEKRLAKELYSLDFLTRKAISNQEMLKHIPAIQPIDNKDLKRTASGWGMRIHPIFNIKKFHYGLDFTAPTGTPIYSTGDGEIEFIIKHTDKDSHGYGNLIIIDHGYGYKTLYAHMDKFSVKVGQEVKRGQTIGSVGNTGLSTGPHLHYEVIKDGRKVNPVYYLFNDLTPQEYQKIVEISNSIKKSYD
ncbi:MAG TPA: M23 family metallopeptidase [Candidatus Paceibacterota bacterium]|nr:M23 family metallopeptidase [Candidatus Paceibacterota bacterium]